MSAHWETLSSTEKEKNPFWTYRIDRFRTKDGQEGDYHYVTNDDAVGVFGRLDDGRFVMVREYRYTFDRMSLSHVQGGIEPGEDPAKAAGREFEEETGFLPGKVERVGWFATVPGYSAERIDIFYATDLKETQQNLDPLEEIEVVTLSFDDIESAIKNEEIWDSQTIAAWALLKNKYLGR